MTKLIIVFILIWNGQVSWLTNQFTWGKLICERDDIVFQSETDIKKTYHTFTLPEGNWDCIITSFGDGFTFPSQWDMVDKEL